MEDKYAFSENLLTRSLTMLEESRAEKERKIAEYDHLAAELIKMGQKSCNMVKIPISGDIAFFHGKTKHANEVLVHLGNNYFVERTAHECQDIISRRKEKIIQNLEQVEKDVEKQVGIKDLLKKETEAVSKPGDAPETRWTDDGILEINEAYASDED